MVLPGGTKDSHWEAQGENFIELGQANDTESWALAETFKIHHEGNGQTWKALVQDKDNEKGNRSVDSESDDLKWKRILGDH